MRASVRQYFNSSIYVNRKTTLMVVLVDIGDISGDIGLFTDKRVDAVFICKLNEE